ncbi:MAG: hypothetical protein GXO00_02570 [Candidatus Diapherotrites archaeon]|nr:hypothetical protein [Candidatus Diapherotrites archaeon]
MSRLARRTLSDLVDVPALLTATLIFYLIINFVSIPIHDAILNALAEYVLTFSFARSVYAFFSSLTDPIVLFSLLLTLILHLYVYAFVVARIWQKRTGEIDNPFRRAVERMIHVFVAGLFVSFLPLLFFILFLIFQAVPPWNTVYFILFFLSTFLWVPLTLPVIAAAVVENLRGRDIVYEGMLAGRVYWWKIFLLLFILGPVLFFIFSYVYLVPVLGPALYTALSTIYVLALSAESYYGFKHGE